jgi:hypothetical protein
MLIEYEYGWDGLAKYSKRPRRTLIRQKEALIKAGVIDFPLNGFPPKKVMRWKPDLYDEFKKENEIRKTFGNLKRK